jgi:hypothetical protein
MQVVNSIHMMIWWYPMACDYGGACGEAAGIMVLALQEHVQR